ncbi:MAG: 16S rRNA (cytosine(1402)-N(4))-methyltransferase RsmH [Bacteroidia bacterium]
MDDSPKPQRRIRYKGTHPKSFKEKYKELNADKYASDVEKIRQQGKTPAGTHVPIMVKEILEVLKPRAGETGLDATLGYGGHAQEMLKCIQPGGHLYATDVDAQELPRTTERLRKLGYGDDTFHPRQLNFSSAIQLKEESGGFDFILADLGVSSMQIDNPERGFTYKHDGPLDLRLNPKKGISAAQLLQKVSTEELELILQENADEPLASTLALTITKNRERGKHITTTTHLRQLITAVVKHEYGEVNEQELRKTCQRTFQALRIAVNQEFTVLEKFLEVLPELLKPGGRVVILTFHSGEDRRVKKAFQLYERTGIFEEYSKEPVRPGMEECRNNPRSKPTKLRWGVRKT